MVLVGPEQIADVMALSPMPHSFADLDAQVAQGLPKSALKASVDRVAISTEERRELLYRLIPAATYKRRRERLTPEESGRTERLARVYATAAYVWDSEADAQAFLHAPHPMLEGQTPLDVALTEPGARQVETLLWQLFYGVTA